MEFAASLEPFLCPLAAFLDPNDSSFFRTYQAEQEELADHNRSAQTWASSPCNPRNRLDALLPKQRTSWRIEGSAAMGRLLFATPILLLPDLPVKRIDVLIPCQSAHPPALRRMLGSSALYHVSSAAVRHLDISRYFEQVLSAWSSRQPYFTEIYKALPFGSRILIENVATDIREVRVRFLPNNGLLEKCHPLKYLQQLWDPTSTSCPPNICVTELQHVEHLNGNVSIIEMPRMHGSRRFVFKTNLRDPDAIHHELRLLLIMDLHPNIIGKPLYIITAEADDEPVKVLGFVLEIYGSGTLGAALDRDSNLSLGTKLRWAEQVVRTIIDIQHGPAGFYSDLKPDNLLVSCDGLDLLFIDFEQGGNWDTFLAPEILYVRWMQGLVRNTHVPEHQRKRYAVLLATIDEHQAGNDATSPDHTRDFRRCWESMQVQHREKAMVFAVGKLLWCMFEGVSHTRNMLDERYDLDTPIDFPNFSRTPEILRGVIKQCTAGAPEWKSPGHGPGIRRRQLGFVSMSATPRSMTGYGVECTPRQAMDASREMWKTRLQQMEDYMEARHRWLTDSMVECDSELLGFQFRPSLVEILSAIQDERVKTN